MRQVRRQLGAGYFFDGFGFSLGEVVTARIAFSRHALGHTHQGRKRTGNNLIPCIGHAFGHDAVSFGLIVQPPHLTDVRPSQQLSNLWSDLSRFGIGTIATADNQIGLFVLHE